MAILIQLTRFLDPECSYIDAEELGCQFALDRLRTGRVYWVNCYAILVLLVAVQHQMNGTLLSGMGDCCYVLLCGQDAVYKQPLFAMKDIFLEN